MLNKQEHNEILNKIKQDGVPTTYPTTLLGNYKHDTVIDIMADVLQHYREAQINKLKKNTHD
jgi:riboflavin synthase alpha subunit